MTGCKKFIEVDAPTTSVNAGNVYEEDVTASAAVTGIYAKMANNYFSLNMSIIPELSADNLTLFNLSNIDYLSYYQNTLTPDYPLSTTKFWTDIYPLIYITNAALEGLNKSKTLTTEVKNRLLGETYFLRGFYYFYLVNLYGDVPLILGTDYTLNSRYSRNSITDIYKQILADLNQAKVLLGNNYVDASLLNSTAERTRPNKMAVNAMLARVYLYLKRYQEAKAAATEVINYTALYSSSLPLDQMFLKNSMETIWSLQPVIADLNTAEANTYILPIEGPNPYENSFYLSNELMAQFEEGDQRKINWTSSVTAEGKVYQFSTKYKVVRGISDVSEYAIVLRLAEQYLIRSEAELEQNNLEGCKDDLNVIRQRAGLPKTSATTQTDLLNAVLKERRVELFTEWGHRWLDLKRTGKVDEIMQTATPLKGGEWNPFKALYPVPLSDIQIDNLLTQNPGYN